MHRACLHGSILAASLLAGTGVSAQQAAQQAAREPLWELGGTAIGITQQAYPGADEQVQRALAFPFFIYRGQILRADRDGAGLRAIKTPRFELDLGVAGAFGSRSSEVKARRGMPDLGTLIEFGPRLRWTLGEANPSQRWRFEVPLRGVFDLNDGAAHRGMALEPELSLARQGEGGWSWSASVSAIVADRRLARTFYEVAPAYATADRPAYTAQAGLVAWRLSGSFTRKLGPDWRVFGFARVEDVSRAANADSPLVRRNTGASVGLGLAYTWLRSERRADE